MATSAASARPAGPSWVRSTAAGLTVRPMGEADLPFLRQVYAATRQAELALVDWSQAQKDAFVAMQFAAQHAHYRTHHADMDWLVVSLHGAPAGRLYLDRGPAGHAVVDIALSADHRGRGLGTALLRDLLDEARAVGRFVTLHVEGHNPAQRLYRRLGFATVEDGGVYDRMVWTPGQEKTAS